MLKLAKQLFIQNELILRQLTSKSLGISLLNRNYSNPSYEGDGKTNCKVLNNDLEMGLMVNSYSEVNVENNFLPFSHRTKTFLTVLMSKKKCLLSAWFSTQ